MFRRSQQRLAKTEFSPFSMFDGCLIPAHRRPEFPTATGLPHPTRPISLLARSPRCHGGFAGRVNLHATAVCSANCHKPLGFAT